MSKRLPGWDGAFGVDFSGYGIGGTSCASCRSFLGAAGGRLHCGSPEFIKQMVPGKRQGEDVIPVASGDPGKYCCNAWGLSKDEAG